MSAMFKRAVVGLVLSGATLASIPGTVQAQHLAEEGTTGGCISTNIVGTVGWMLDSNCKCSYAAGTAEHYMCTYQQRLAACFGFKYVGTGGGCVGLPTLGKVGTSDGLTWAYVDLESYVLRSGGTCDRVASIVSCVAKAHDGLSPNGAIHYFDPPVSAHFGNRCEQKTTKCSSYFPAIGWDPYTPTEDIHDPCPGACVGYDKGGI